VDWVEDLGDGLTDFDAWLDDDVREPVWKFFETNPSPAIASLGAAIALSTASFVHYDRVRRERTTASGRCSAST
jgi:hypothetical protein